MVAFRRLMISNNIVRRLPTSFISTPVRFMNTTGFATGTGSPPISTVPSDFVGRMQAYSARNKDLISFAGVILGVIYSVGYTMSKVATVETELKNMDKNTARKEEITKLEARVDSMSEIAGLKAQTVSLQSFINREASIARGKASREEPSTATPGKEGGK